MTMRRMHVLLDDGREELRGTVQQRYLDGVRGAYLGVGCRENSTGGDARCEPVARCQALRTIGRQHALRQHGWQFSADRFVHRLWAPTVTLLSRVFVQQSCR